MECKWKGGRLSNKNPSPSIRFKNGQVANPRGAGAHDPVKRALKQLTIVELREIIACALVGDVSDLEAIARDKNAPTSLYLNRRINFLSAT